MIEEPFQIILQRLEKMDGDAVGARKEMLEAIKEVNLRVTSLYVEIEAKYVRKDYFDAVLLPIKAVVFGLAGLILIGVGTAILALVIRSGATQ
jgi:hypothetical protein